jgi:peptidoglycan pentaglycine glycine transferase (the first glycine)
VTTDALSTPDVAGMRAVSGAGLAGWDEAAVTAPGGHVFQSRAFGEFQAGLGWTPRYLRFADGFPVLVLQRRWPLIGGWSAYIPRGPVPTESPERTADRLIAVTHWLGSHGVAVTAADPEVPAHSPFGERIRAAGFRPIPEIQPSRHRMRIVLDGRTEDEVFRGITKSSRQRIAQAEQSGITVATIDAPPARAQLDGFYDLLRGTGERRGFTFGSREEFAGWWEVALAAGHLVYLAASSPTDGNVAGLVLYRHGGRLSTVHSADVATLRSRYPGALHLLRWRAIQLALATGCSEMDLGGVDIAGARRVPAEGEPMYGLYEHKRGFGAEWVDLAGAHEFVARPLWYAAGRVTQRIARLRPDRRPGRMDA